VPGQRHRGSCPVSAPILDFCREFGSRSTVDSGVILGSGGVGLTTNFGVTWVGVCGRCRGVMAGFDDVTSMERPMPPLNTDERTTMESWLDFYRVTLAPSIPGWQ
jgi:hypothetical protein